MVIVQHFPDSVNKYAKAVLGQRLVLSLPDRCPHPDCQAEGALIRWGYYTRWACTAERMHLLRIQRVRCKECGRTHSLLPDFLHPHRQYVLDLMQRAVRLYLLAGLSWARLLSSLADPGPARSTVREWLNSFGHGAGELLLDIVQRELMELAPLAELPDGSAPHLARVRDPTRRRGLERAHRFWLLAERLYAQIKAHLPRLHFSAQQLFGFLLHWLQSQQIPPRLFWSPALPNTPTQPF